tara:strand:- start:4 stop:231 length:228 start_codon:yes stop_codon:yes gene_type:complete
MITFLEFTEVLKYDSDVLRQSTFTPEERWSIAQERSIIIGDYVRKSYITKKTYSKCETLLKEIKETNWGRTNTFQ